MTLQHEPRTGPAARAKARAYGWLADEEGAILVFWAVALVVILGMTGLAFDFGRVATTQSELQSYADHVALAAAGELDGQSDAITRATAAAANLISDTQTFGNGGQSLAGAASYTLAFYASLPSNDTAAMTDVTTDPAKTAFVRVLVKPKTVPYTLMAAVAALTGSPNTGAQVGATAVAGFTQYACDITPMMMCLPPGFTAGNHKGDMVVLRSGGQGAAWGPGDFGFISPASGALADPSGPCAGISSGPQLLQCVLAAAGPVTQCFAQRGVDTEPGQKVGLTNTGLNVRFDMYAGSMQSARNDPDYEPAPNVIKGIVPKGGGSCIKNNSDTSPDTVALPHDACIDSGSCGRFGDGDWSAGRTAYWTTNHGGTADPFPAAQTRYDYYKAEIAAGGGGAATTSILSGRAETGRPMCSANQSSDPARRTIIVAGIDCTTNPINGATTGIPVSAFYRIFLTEPVGTDDSVSPPSFTIYGEIVGRVDTGGGGASGIIHDVVQLYR